MKIEQSFFTESGSILRNEDERPCLAVTLGDPAGIGPEVILKALADPWVTDNCRVTVVGSRSLLQKTYFQLQQMLPGESLVDPDSLSILDVEIPNVDGEITFGCGNAASGAVSFAFLETAIAKTLAGEFQGIVTGPIAKSAWQAAGHDYPGQTELLAERADAERFGMLFVARSPHTGWTLRTLLATTHIPLSQVPELLTPELMSRKLDLLVGCLQKDFGIAEPKIAIAGLNPHSGEQGQLGVEEKYWIGPWLEWERKRRSDIVLDGPIPPDTMWVKPGQAWFGNRSSASISTYDGYLALYHDQGLIPVKLMAFDRAINTTIGLPFVRTSPDHGTAFDIAGKGIANPASMKAALQLAVELVKQRS
ncbi:4-hydroxythreonine-4-phosphate dehydrogenase PdxA [Phormidium sp. LEGE 05292]|uniref:4-hydroxythreonine-4-phosphate dehydrogenase PdxA n=1 Tax=[Phormidium] sp. LEGE 05292 TaxID=767427 RepID=UPI0018811862|nr:4-hydroxythreonine-4-phosphate dehydrogenase PdxA [Phormidium sp. LEGE 05292]MBE9228691.1 4-hydroxythreonine-4-phosphate dehydrogenase PdxA [Phormidium sp. LEGE 05292]